MSILLGGRFRFALTGGFLPWLWPSPLATPTVGFSPCRPHSFDPGPSLRATHDGRPSYSAYSGIMQPQTNIFGQLPSSDDRRSAIGGTSICRSKCLWEFHASWNEKSKHGTFESRPNVQINFTPDSFLWHWSPISIIRTMTFGQHFRSTRDRLDFSPPFLRFRPVKLFRSWWKSRRWEDTQFVHIRSSGFSMGFSPKDIS